jgi:hypothetical protein
MASPEQLSVTNALEMIPPKDGVELVGFGLVAEWEGPNGQRLLTGLIGQGGNPWQVKGYFYDGLNGHWPMPGGESNRASQSMTGLSSWNPSDQARFAGPGRGAGDRAGACDPSMPEPGARPTALH